MKKNRIALRSILYFSFCILLVDSCKKKEEEEPAPKPNLSIEFLSISPSSVKEYTDSITITFSYEDLDGDLGENDPNKTNLFVTDSRNNVEYQYRISQLAPDGAGIHIKGKLNVVIKNTAITDGSSSQAVTYSLYVKDRAGNQSNSITTTSVTVIK
jgi:hypothetical protein